MQGDYNPCCDDHIHIVNADNNELDKLSADIARKLYKFKQMPPGIGRKLTLQYALTLWEGVLKGYGYNVEDLQYDSPDQNMLLNLQSNVYAFAGAKTWHQMQHLTKALIDPETNKIRSFREFKIEADKINKWYSKTALNAEYNTAIAGAQMASKWVEIQEQGDPMLEFDAVMDGQTTDLCRSLNGVTLPSSDPFWQQYYPPNHFACRSTVRITYGRTPTDRSTIVYPDKMPDMFKTNLAQTGVIFPPNHSYWLNIPKEVLEKALKLQPKHHQFITIREFDNGGKIKISTLHDIGNSSDFNKVMKIAEYWADQGDDIEVLPKITIEDEKNYKKVYGHLIGTDYEKKSQDIRRNGVHYEHEGHEAWSNPKKWASRMISKGADQSSRIIIDETNDTDNALRRKIFSIQNQIEKPKNIEEVWVLTKSGKLRLIYKKA